MGHGRGRIAAAMVGFGVLLTGLLSGCTTSVTYVGSSTQDMYFKIPNTWKVFNQSTLQENGWIDPAASNQAALAGQSHPVYETVAGANPKVARSVDTQSGPYPWAMAQVVALDGEDQANTSLAALADENYPIDQLNQDGDRVQQLSPTKVPGGRRIAGQSGRLPDRQPADRRYLIRAGRFLEQRHRQGLATRRRLLAGVLPGPPGRVGQDREQFHRDRAGALTACTGRTPSRDRPVTSAGRTGNVARG